MGWDMLFSFVGEHQDERFHWFSQGLREAMGGNGHRFAEEPDDARLVMNFFPAEKPSWFRRKAQAVFVVGISEMEPPFDRPIPQGYPFLVRSISNLFIGLVDRGRPLPDAHFLTPEQGHYVVEGREDRESYFREIYGRIEPLATSDLVIDNVFHRDLPEELRDGDEATEAIGRAGAELDAMDLLPAPFPLKDILTEREMRHLKRLYGIGGLSYGNISARYEGNRFWMSASGVDKSNLTEIGRDILMVKDYDPEQRAMILSIPPDVEPRRVSVDAIEHWLIYREHPEVGAILHVHAWMDGVPSTEFNYPCGTYEMGEAVAEIVRQADDPARAVVGLKNHGLTITGESLDEIFERVKGRLHQRVPME